MKQRKFIHRLVDMVERELEATLAILVVLAAVVGYTLAGTETATNLITAQETSGSAISVGSGTYATLSFDSTYKSGSTYTVRQLSISPSDAVTIKGKGLSGASAVTYTATIPLSASFTGGLYVHGEYTPSAVSLNGTSITSPTTKVTVIDAQSLILTFTGVKNHIEAISIHQGTTPTDQPKTVANLSLLPTTTTTLVGTPRNFIVVATDSTGAAVPSDDLNITWTVETTPKNIATINSKGVVTPTAAGTVVVTAKTGNKISTATITVVEAVKEVPKPITTDTTDKTIAAKPIEEKPANSWETDWGATRTVRPVTDNQKTIIEQVAELLVQPADAATEDEVKPAQVVTQVLFSDAATIARQSTAPTNAELKVATQNLTLVQKVTTTIAVAAQQIRNDIRSMFVGTEIKDTEGNVVLKQPNALNLFAQKIKTLFGGVGAAPAKIGVGDEEVD